MSFLDYLKERWITYVFFFLASSFSYTVYKLEQNLSSSQSNVDYIATGCGLLLVLFVAVDFYTIKSRFKRMKRFCELHASTEEVANFTYPLDRKYGELVQNIIVADEEFQAKIRTTYADELDFIKKWLHDVKVPISAAKLILETSENEMPPKVYQSIDNELFTIENSVEKVFYEIKTNRFYDDYKISAVNTKRLISLALKDYANFFSYKKLTLSIKGVEGIILTDEKWSTYILSQILFNAVKYTDYGGGIVIQTDVVDLETTISIKNYGSGILEEDIGQVFNKGFTSSVQRHGMKATGYGLYLAKKLSDMLGHKLTVNSHYQEYAEFRITFMKTKTIHDVTKM
ncbi:sensor histidine kinase [Anaerobacillus sp. CMMVII]|uniref:sensor histidine kinase n=1 Tax=Anaerobacillus sp. CMMVII TaxID=2755588 RepID=UPI0021B847CD|nr:sensor histidine kinase [Anaerobacillus sp. CMMVII]MCT8138015.1 sensor histidine kinase [Anaerobacillus sp. CMMVII]